MRESPGKFSEQFLTEFRNNCMEKLPKERWERSRMNLWRIPEGILGRVPGWLSAEFPTTHRFFLGISSANSVSMSLKMHIFFHQQFLRNIIRKFTWGLIHRILPKSRPNIFFFGNPFHNNYHFLFRMGVPSVIDL